MKKSIKVLFVVVALFVLLAVAVGADYRTYGMYRCKSATCSRYNDAGARVGFHWNGKIVEIRSIQVHTIAIKNWWRGNYSYVRRTMGLSYGLHMRDGWVIMAQWEKVQ